MFSLQNVTLKREDHIVFENLNLTIKTGEKIVLLGINGSGKSTLLKLMNGLEFPDSGEMLYEGKALTKSALKHKQVNENFRKNV